MRVVSVKEKSGVTVISADNARRYIGLSPGKRGARRALYEKLHSALAAYEKRPESRSGCMQELVEAEPPLPYESTFPCMR